MDGKKFLVPVFLVVYADDESEATEIVEHAVDNCDLILEDGIYSIEVIEHDVEEHLEEYD